jgi:hypothetical protein
MLKNVLKIILYKVQNCSILKNCSNTKIVQIQKLFKFENCSISKNCSYSKNVQTRNLFKVQNCSISKNCSNMKIVQIQKWFNFEKLFILENCSNSKFVQTRKLFKLKIVQTQKKFKFENYSYFEFMQIRNCLKNEKPKKPAEQWTREKEKPSEIYRKYKPALNGPRPISLRLRAEPAKARPRAEHRIYRSDRSSPRTRAYGPLAHGPAGPARAHNVAQQPKAGLAFSR